MNETTTAALPRRGYLGLVVTAHPAPPHLVSEGAERWIISELAGPSAESSLQLGDDLLELDGERIHSLAQLRARASAVAPGRSCRLSVLRQGRLVHCDVRSTIMPVERFDSARVELDDIPWSWQGRDYRLRVIWTRPVVDNKLVVWLLPSAAWISQESPLDTEDPTFQLIEFLGQQGISTFRVERSGLGDSEGPHCSSLDFEGEVGGLRAARDYFLRHTQGRRAEGGKRALFGRSLGGVLAPLVALDHEIDRICVWGTTGERWHDGSLESVAYQRQLHGQTGAALEVSMRRHEMLQRLVLLEGLSPAEARERHPELVDEADIEYRGTLVHDRLWTYFHQLQMQDVPQAWARSSAEVLAVHAEFDIIVPRAALEKLVHIRGAAARLHCLSGVDHFMHERTSLEDAVRHPWAGKWSRRAGQLIADFLLHGHQGLQ